MKNKSFLIVFVLVIQTDLYASVIIAESAHRECIEFAITRAEPGDTIIVPEGTAVWNDQLVITKGVIIKGQGSNKTVVISNYPSPNPNNGTDSVNYLISYSPSSPELNEPFRLSGFTFDLNENSSGVNVFNGVSNPIRQIRIDNNVFKNVSFARGRGILIRGTVYGVIDNNTFINCITPLNVLGNQADSWKKLIYDFGTADNIYIEDNIVEAINNPIINSGWGGRYSARYNTVIADRNIWGCFDMHGNLSSNYSLMGAEIYGNRIQSSTGYVELVDQRGGKALVFYNTAICSGRFSTKLREEYADSLNPPAFSPLTGQPQHVSESYYWNNRINYSGDLADAQAGIREEGIATGGGNAYLEDLTADFSSIYGERKYYGLKLMEGTGAGQHKQIIDSSPTRLTVASEWDVIPDSTTKYQINQDAFGVLAEDREFWNQKEDFYGASGIGCGLLEDRPTAEDCSPGVGYWASEQSCDSVSVLSVGAHPQIPISGVLYRCVEENGNKVWESYYTPYPYPHPLRVSGPLADNSQTTTYVDEEKKREQDLALYQNYPNPFNSATTITYTIIQSNLTTLKVYDLLGREVVTLVNEVQSPGSHHVQWDGRNAAGLQVGSGVYLYRLNSGEGFSKTKKMLLMR